MGIAWFQESATIAVGLIGTDDVWYMHNEAGTESGGDNIFVGRNAGNIGNMQYGWAGPLNPRVSDTAGTVTVDAGHNFSTLLTCYVTWNAGVNYRSGVRVYANEIINGGFDTDTADWTKGTDWLVDDADSNVAAKTAGTASNLSQAIVLANGVSYTLIYTLTRTAGTITPKVGGTSCTARSAGGTFTETLAVGTADTLVFEADAAFEGTIDNVILSREALTATALQFDGGAGDALPVQDTVVRIGQAQQNPAYTTAIGEDALSSLTRGMANTCGGWKSGQTIDIGYRNTFWGASTGPYVTSGNYLDGFGYASFLSATTARACVGMGANTFYYLTTGYYNTAVGTDASQYAQDTHDNVAVGTLADNWNVSGDYNTFVGSNAGYGYETYSHDGVTAVGYHAAYQIRTGNYGCYYGLGAGSNSYTGSYQFVMGTNQQADGGDSDYFMNLNGVLKGLAPGSYGNLWMPAGSSLHVNADAASTCALDVKSKLATAAGLMVYGGDTVGAGHANSGQILLGNAAARASFAYDGNTGYAYLDSAWDSASALMYVRMRTAGTPVVAARIDAAGYWGFGLTAKQRVDVLGPICCTQALAQNWLTFYDLDNSCYSYSIYGGSIGECRLYGFGIYKTWGATACTYTNNLACLNDAAKKLTSASYNFVAGDVGSIVTLTAGTNLTPGNYTIASIDGVGAILSADPCSGGDMSAGSGYISYGAGDVIIFDTDRDTWLPVGRKFGVQCDPAYPADLRAGSSSTPAVRVWGGSSVGVASLSSGQILLGDTAAYQGVFSYSASDGILYIDNTYDHANGKIYIRTKTAGTPVNCIIIGGAGDVTLASDLTIGGALDHNGTTVGFYGTAPVVQPAHVADPTACAAMTFAHVWDGAVYPTAAQGAQLIADLAALKAAIDANNAAIDSILAQLATLGLQAAA